MLKVSLSYCISRHRNAFASLPTTYVNLVPVVKLSKQEPAFLVGVMSSIPTPVKIAFVGAGAVNFGGPEGPWDVS